MKMLQDVTGCNTDLYELIDMHPGKSQLGMVATLQQLTAAQDLKTRQEHGHWSFLHL